MLNIILIAIMLIVLSLGIFFFPMVLGLSCWFSMFLLGISIMYLFQDIVFKANSILLGIGDLLLKISYFSLTFAICFVQQKSFLSYVFYGAVFVVGLFDIFVLRVKRKDIFLDGENKKTAYDFLKYAISPKKLKNQSGISDDSKKLECYKGYYYTKVAFISNIIVIFVSVCLRSMCEPRSMEIFNFVCLAIIVVISVIATVFHFISIKALKAPLGYKISVLVIVFSPSILLFSGEVYFSDAFQGAILVMLGYMFFGISMNVPALSSLYYNKQLAEIEKIES